MKTHRQQRSKPQAPARDSAPPGGQPLPDATQSRMSQAFGHHFSSVRVFADDAAAESAQGLGADAYTVGSDIFFNNNSYDPDSPDGQKLLAHELTHVVQRERNGDAAGALGAVSDPGDASEREASALAGRAAAGQRVEVRAAPTAQASRGLLGWIEGEASSAAHTVEHAASGAVQSVGGAASRGLHAVEGAASEGWHRAEGLASEGLHRTEHAASEVGHGVSHAWHSAENTASAGLHRAEHIASEGWHRTEHAASEGLHRAEHAASEGWHGAKHMASRAGHAASEEFAPLVNAETPWQALKAEGSIAHDLMRKGGGLIQSAERGIGSGIDWAEDHEKSATAWAANKAHGIPVLEQVADAGKGMLDTQTEFVGGVGRGVTGLVGGVAGMVVNPVDTAAGLEAMAEHIPGVGGTALKGAHGLLNVAMGDETMAQLGHSLSPEQSLHDDGQFWKGVGGGLVGQYSEQWHQGKYADVLGHGVFDVASLVTGAGEAGAAAKAAEAAKFAEAAKLAESARIAGKVSEVAPIVGEASHLAPAIADASHAAPVAADAGGAADLGLSERGHRPQPGERATTRAEYDAARHAERQPGFDSFQEDWLQSHDTAGLSPDKVREQIRLDRAEGQVRGADVQRFHGYTDAPTGRMAEIDERTGANYQRLLDAQLSEQPSMYRYTSRRTAGRYESAGSINRPAYMTDEPLASNAQTMSRAQVAPEWGVHEVGIQVPSAEIIDARVPRPFGNSPHVNLGWEPRTNSYPEYGQGGATQFVGKTRSYDPAWASDLTDDFARTNAPAAPVTVPAVGASVPTVEAAALPATTEAALATVTAPATAPALIPGAEGLSSRVDEAARLRQSGGGGSDSLSPVPAPKSPEQHLIDETNREFLELQRRADLNRKDPEYLSRNGRGAVLSGILDTADAGGQVHFGLNNGGQDHLDGKVPPNNIHPLLQERLEAQSERREESLKGLQEKEAADMPLTREEQGVVTAGVPGFHSEVYALDAALKAREGRTGVPVTPDDLGGFLLHNIGLRGKHIGEVPYRCFNCDPLTDGVSLTGPLQESEARFHGR